MLWYKAWLDTRSRFLIGLALLLVAACGTVVGYDQVRDLVAGLQAPPGDSSTPIGRAVNEALELERTFRGFVWHEWFEQNFSSLITLLAALLGSGSALSASGRGLLFSLALPVSRGRWLGARAGIGLAQLFAFAVLPSLLIAVLAPVTGEQFGLGAAFVHGVCAFFASSVFFAVASLLSTVFNDLWRPLLLSCLVALAVGFVGLALPTELRLFAVMSGETWFHDASVPWGGLLVSAALTVVLLYSARALLARRDY